jgi:hypothetical protein
MRLAVVLVGSLLALCVTGSLFADDMFGSTGRSGPNPGSLLSINQVNGAGVLIGNTVGGGQGVSGLSFNGAGQLYGSTVSGLGLGSNLLLINPATGGVVLNVGPVLFGGNPISIGDLAFQPGTGVLFGIRSNTDGNRLGGQLFTINTATAAATLVGDTGAGAGGGIAFAPNGTLYQSSYNSNADFTSLNVINPANASRISTVAVNTYYDGLAVRSDGTIFATPGDSDGIFTINPVNGVSTLVGNTGVGFTSDLAFLAAVPEPSTVALISAGVLGIVGYRWRASRRKNRRK